MSVAECSHVMVDADSCSISLLTMISTSLEMKTVLWFMTVFMILELTESTVVCLVQASDPHLSVVALYSENVDEFEHLSSLQVMNL